MDEAEAKLRSGIWKVFRVRIRRDIGVPVRPEAEQLDGKMFLFRACGTMTAEERPEYAGEKMWMADDSRYPKDAPAWLAEGDLEPAEFVATVR